MNQPQSVTEDTLLGGRVRLRQPAAGYRAGMDAVLLAASCDAGPDERVLDVGCGVGAVMLAAAARLTGARFVGLERDPAALALAHQNIALNGWADRMSALPGDVAERWSKLALQPFDAVLCNPPYFDDPSALRGPAPAKQGAWLADVGLAGWIGFLIKAVREGGTITLIHRADRLPDILRLFAPKVGGVQMRSIHPFADTPAKRVIVRGVKTARAPMRVLPGLVLHDASVGKPTVESNTILRGGAIAWT